MGSGGISAEDYQKMLRMTNGMSFLPFSGYAKGLIDNGMGVAGKFMGHGMPSSMDTPYQLRPEHHPFHKYATNLVEDLFEAGLAGNKRLNKAKYAKELYGTGRTTKELVELKDRLDREDPSIVGKLARERIAKDVEEELEHLAGKNIRGYKNIYRKIMNTARDTMLSGTVTGTILGSLLGNPPAGAALGATAGMLTIPLSTGATAAYEGIRQRHFPAIRKGIKERAISRFNQTTHIQPESEEREDERDAQIRHLTSLVNHSRANELAARAEAEEANQEARELAEEISRTRRSTSGWISAPRVPVLSSRATRLIT
jgi:hypothetical protein